MKESLTNATRAGEPLRIRQIGAAYVLELKSPVHGKWMVVEECRSWGEARERMIEWEDR